MAAICAEDVQALEDAPNTIERIMLAGELMDRYRQAITDLSTTRGLGIVELRIVQRLSDQEIADLLGISRQQVFKLGKEALETLFPDEDVKTMKQAERRVLTTSELAKFGEVAMAGTASIRAAGLAASKWAETWSRITSDPAFARNLENVSKAVNDPKIFEGMKRAAAAMPDPTRIPTPAERAAHPESPINTPNDTNSD